jgi:chondroitin-sulfate-ABC endolyase/exolyase
MLMSEQTYSGALSDGNNGLFAMKLQGHPKYDASFTANKSVFFFDNRIVALGSGITSTDSKHSVQTTLLQHALRLPEEQLQLNNQVVSNDLQINGLQVNGLQTSINVLMDPANNAYFVAGDSSLALTVGEQQSLHQKNSKPTVGSFATAVLDHGIAPTDGEYAYAVLVDTDAKQAQAFAEQLLSPGCAAYVVEQQDNNAHIVWDRASNSRGYAFFTATDKLTDKVIAAIDSPAMVMATTTGKALTLTVVNPDLNLYQGKDDSQYDNQGVQKEVSIYSRQWKDNPSVPVATQLTLKGLWQAAQALPAGVKLTANADGNTLLQVTTVRAESVELSLTLI